MFGNMSDKRHRWREFGGKTVTPPEADIAWPALLRFTTGEYILVTAGAAADATGVPHILDAKTIYNRLGKAVSQKQS